MYFCLSGAQEHEICHHHSCPRVACRNVGWSCSLSSCILFICFHCMGQDLASTSSTSLWLPQVPPKYQKKNENLPGHMEHFFKCLLNQLTSQGFQHCTLYSRSTLYSKQYTRVCFCYSREAKEQRGYHLPITISAFIFWSKYKTQMKIVKTNTKKNAFKSKF